MTALLPDLHADVIAQARHATKLLDDNKKTFQPLRMEMADYYALHHATFSGKRPLDPRSDHRAWRELLASASVRQAKLHDARHTAATVMLTMGVPARVVMQVLGHSQISLTLGTCSHVMPELADDAAARVGDALWGSQATTLAP